MFCVQNPKLCVCVSQWVAAVAPNTSGISSIDRIPKSTPIVMNREKLRSHFILFYGWNTIFEHIFRLPCHNSITFQDSNSVDKLAWERKVNCKIVCVNRIYGKIKLKKKTEVKIQIAKKLKNKKKRKRKKRNESKTVKLFEHECAHWHVTKAAPLSASWATSTALPAATSCIKMTKQNTDKQQHTYKIVFDKSVSIKF